jgi:ABC-type sugar transport system substrate-binding protein
LLAACSSSSGTANSSTPASAGSSAGSGLDAAKADLAKFEDTSSLVYAKPTEAFSPGTHKVMIISCGQTGIGCQQMSAFAQDAAKAMGWTASPTEDGKFDPNQQAAYVNQAVNQGYDAIILASIDAASISAAIDAAVAKKIPIACIMCENPNFTGPVIDTTTGGYPGGHALAAFVAVTLGGKGAVVGFDDKSFPIVATRMQGLKEGLATYCPACTYSQEEFPTSDLSKPGSPTWSAYLSSHPAGTVNFMAGPYDFMSLPAAKVSQQAGRDDIKMSGFDAYSGWVQAIASGNPPAAAATIAAPFEYCAWAAMDEVARVVAGKATWDASKLPVAVVDKSNAAQFTQGYLKPPFDVPTTFKTLWGKS